MAPQECAGYKPALRRLQTGARLTKPPHICSRTTLAIGPTGGDRFEPALLRDGVHRQAVLPQGELESDRLAGRRADIAYMVDQSHNLKGKIEAMIQTVTTAQELFVKAAIVDHERLAACQHKCELVDAENCLKDAFSTDVRPVIAEWSKSKGLPADPMAAFRQSGYLEKITAERCAKNMSSVSSYA